MADPALLSTLPDLRGEAALATFLPPEGATASEVLVVAQHLEKVDAFTACALRALIEYHARVRSTRVILNPPDHAETYRTLWHLLGDDRPKHFGCSNDASPPGKTAPRTVILPATVIPSVGMGDIIAGLVPRLCDPMPKPPARLIAGAFAELVDNALFHGDDSPIGAVAAIFHERSMHALQLVVIDLGARVAREPDAPAALSDCIVESEHNDGGLASLVHQIERRDLDARILIAAGNGRVQWGSGGWTASQAQHVNGFTASVSVRL